MPETTPIEPYNSPDLLKRRLANAPGKVAVAFTRDAEYHAQVMWTEQVLAVADEVLSPGVAHKLVNKIADRLIAGADEALKRAARTEAMVEELHGRPGVR